MGSARHPRPAKGWDLASAKNLYNKNRSCKTDPSRGTERGAKTGQARARRGRGPLGQCGGVWPSLLNQGGHTCRFVGKQEENVGPQERHRKSSLGRLSKSL